MLYLPTPKELERGRPYRSASLLKIQRLFIKLTTTRVAGRSPATGFILLFVVGLKVNCCMLMQDINARNDARL